MTTNRDELPSDVGTSAHARMRMTDQRAKQMLRNKSKTEQNAAEFNLPSVYQPAVGSETVSGCVWSSWDRRLPDGQDGFAWAVPGAL